MKLSLAAVIIAAASTSGVAADGQVSYLLSIVDNFGAYHMHTLITPTPTFSLQ